MLLIPFAFVVYACANFGRNWELFLSYRFSHSNPRMKIFYLSKEARDILRSDVYGTSKEHTSDRTAPATRTAPDTRTAPATRIDRI